MEINIYPEIYNIYPEIYNGKISDFSFYNDNNEQQLIKSNSLNL